MFFAIILPIALLILGIWLSIKLCNRIIRASINFIEVDQRHEFYWDDALAHEPTSEQWLQLQELSKNNLPHIPELISLSADFQWAIGMKNLVEARAAFEELERKLYLLNLHNYESLEKPAEIGPRTTDCYWNC
jgi:hypothetical protein